MIVDDRIAAYINSLESPVTETLAGIEREALAAHVPVIKKPAQGLLRFLLSAHRPGRILEVGTAVGFSAILMSEYIPAESSIVTIEKMPERIEKAKKNIALAGKEKQITILEGDAGEILKELSEQTENRFDFIFMDAAKGQYLHFMPDILKMLPPGGLLVSDNVLQDGDVAQSRYAVTRRNRTIHSRMRDYLYELTHMEELETVVLPIGDGVTLSTRVKQ